MTTVEFYFDPACPWTWITSRWLVEVTTHRDVQVTWRLFSLRHRNRDNPGYDWIRDELNAQHPAMRVLAATGLRHGNDSVGALYTELGTRIHIGRDGNLDGLAEAVAAVGLPGSVLAAADDVSLDPVIEASTREGWDIVGDDAGIPLIVIEGNPAHFFGPVLSPAPTGDAAAELWDAFAVLGRFPGLYEIKRTRNVRPIFNS